MTIYLNILRLAPWMTEIGQQHIQNQKNGGPMAAVVEIPCRVF
jgi:hypothetical protein